MLNADHQRSALTVGVGVASPLWPAFAFAASAGAAYWWMSRVGFGAWRPVFANLEAVLEAPVVVAETAPAAAEPEPVVDTVTAETTKAADAAIDAASETLAAVAEAPVEAAEAQPKPAEPVVDVVTPPVQPAPEPVKVELSKPEPAPAKAAPKAAAKPKPAIAKAPAPRRAASAKPGPASGR